MPERNETKSDVLFATEEQDDGDLTQSYAFLNRRTAEELLYILKASHLPPEEVRLCTKTAHLISYCASRFEYLAKEHSFVHMHLDTLSSLIASQHLTCPDENVVSQIARWIRYDSRDRKQHTEGLLALLPHDHVHPLKYRAGIVTNWDVFYHMYYHPHNHTNNRNRESNSGYRHHHHHRHLHFHLLSPLRLHRHHRNRDRPHENP